MLLIADSGSTKTSWCLLDENGNKSYFSSEGYNPYFVDEKYIIASLTQALPLTLKTNEIKGIHFYGAGIPNEDRASLVRRALDEIFPNSSTFVGHDLLASARALLGSEAGFAAILGTGTNTCFYDGNDVTLNIDCGAHILGDEGSGFYIGKKILVDFIRGYMPEDLSVKFKQTYNLTPDDIHYAVYTQPLANRYCASFSKFIAEDYLTREYSRNIVKTSFDDFFRNIVSHYPDYQKYSFNCVGSIGCSFEVLLKEVAAEWGMEFGKVIQSPLNDLVNYHLSIANKRPINLGV